MRSMYDSIRAERIPANAQMVAGYCDTIRIPQWTDAEWRMFENVPRVRIAKKASTNDGHVLDVEQGDANPVEAPAWVLMRRRAGMEPTVYCSLSVWKTVRSQFYTQGVDEPYYWIAKYDGDPNWLPGWAASRVVAKQWKNTTDWDISSVADYWPGVDSRLVSVKEGLEMFLPKANTGQKVVVIPCNGLKQLFCHVPGASTGETLDGHAYFVGDTPAGTGGNYKGDRSVHFDADRPGPVGIPDGTRSVALYYTSTADATAWCA